MDPMFSKAYAVYYVEASKEIVALADVINSLLDAAGSYSIEVVKDGKVRAHRLKGGAGLFGLSTLASLASQLEHYFTDIMAGHKGQEFDIIRDLIEKLELEVKRLPAPQV